MNITFELDDLGVLITIEKKNPDKGIDETVVRALLKKHTERPGGEPLSGTLSLYYSESEDKYLVWQEQYVVSEFSREEIAEVKATLEANTIKAALLNNPQPKKKAKGRIL